MIPYSRLILWTNILQFFQFFPILRIKCLWLFMRQSHCACAEPRFVQKIKFYAN